MKALKRSFALLLVLSILFSIPALAVSDNARKVVAVAAKQLGKPYELHPDAPHSFNCASLVIYCFGKVKKGVVTSDGIKGNYKKIGSKSDLKIGDIVCFKNSKCWKPRIMNYHFGIYCGKGYFIHATIGKGVIRSKVSKYDGKWLGAYRVL